MAEANLTSEPMTPETLEALRGSVAKWEGIVDGTIVDQGMRNCPLCQLFLLTPQGYPRADNPCVGCPVYESTGLTGCKRTPYVQYDQLRDRPSYVGEDKEARLHEIAQREVDFLKSLLPPGAGDPQTWHVFKLTDCEWWVARNLAEAIEDYTRQTGEPVEADDAHELSEAELDRLHYIDTDENDDQLKESRRPFRQELAQRVAAGLSKPELFACTEY